MVFVGQGRGIGEFIVQLGMEGLDGGPGFLGVPVEHHIDGFNVYLLVEIFGGWGVEWIFIEDESERGVLDHLQFIDFTVWSSMEWDCRVDETG